MLLNPADPREELVEHLWLFNLLGDPLLKLRQPQAIPLTAPAEVPAAGTIEIAATIPIAGEATLELVPRRDRQPGVTPRRPRFAATAEMQAEFAETYRRANAPAPTRVTRRVAPGKAVLRLEVPAGALGPCQCLLYVEGQEDCAAGAADVEIVARGPAWSGPSAARAGVASPRPARERLRRRGGIRAGRRIRPRRSAAYIAI